MYPKKVDIDALQARVNTMQIPALIQPQHKLLEQAANAFLDRFRLLRKENAWHNNALDFIKFRLEVKKAGWDETQKHEYYQSLKHSNRLSGNLSGTLDLMSLSMRGGNGRFRGNPSGRQIMMDSSMNFFR
ncbi:TPA: hypothetical protein MOX26_004372 [Salmonella enterica subsp. enterica serovar Ball]|nr:hypothetical protein [Salmonella enterica subsp. enterica serovar Ball]HCA3488368.1 hypothetical protein [Salmonella enterica subsp. enterica serovar Ball]HCA3563338.1 hypothetical protein [Salmonella enterica subsp. enterica serovar Ball]